MRCRLHSKSIGGVEHKIFRAMVTAVLIKQCVSVQRTSLLPTSALVTVMLELALPHILLPFSLFLQKDKREGKGTRAKVRFKLKLKTPQVHLWVTVSQRTVETGSGVIRGI